MIPYHFLVIGSIGYALGRDQDTACESIDSDVPRDEMLLKSVFHNLGEEKRSGDTA